MGVWDFADLSKEGCDYGKCEHDAWCKVVYQKFPDNPEVDSWQTKHFCHLHFHKKFIIRRFGTQPLYRTDAKRCKLDWFNREKPTE